MATGGSLNGLWWLGFIFSVTAQLVGIIGNQLVKYAHNQNQGRPDERRVASFKQPIWLAGMFMITVLNTSLNLAAFAFAAQSLLATFGSVSLLWNLLVSKLFTHEKPSAYEYTGTLVALVGVTLSTVFGPHVTADYERRKLEALYGRTAFIAYGVVLACWMAGLLVLRYRRMPLRRMAAAVFPGCCGGLTALFSKSTVEMIKSEARGGSDFSYFTAYLILAAAITAAVLQIVFLNKCLREYDPLFIVPVYQSSLLLTSAITGTIYFEEYRNQSRVALAMFPTGVVLTLVALAIFAARPSGPERQLVAAYSDSTSPDADADAEAEAARESDEAAVACEPEPARASDDGTASSDSSAVSIGLVRPVVAGDRAQPVESRLVSGSPRAVSRLAPRSSVGAGASRREPLSPQRRPRRGTTATESADPDADAESSFHTALSYPSV